MNDFKSKSLKIENELQRLEREFASRNPLSLIQHKRANVVLPGGHSRQTLLYAPFPLTIIKGDGVWLRDIDQHDYLDFLGDFTAGLYGHSNNLIGSAISSVIDNGISIGGITQIEATFAELICNQIASIEQVRFCNSGTEACLFAVSVARAITNRSRILVFSGAYHGGFMIFGNPDSELNIPGNLIKCTFNNVDETRKTIKKYGPQIAAVIVEPVMGSAGAIPASTEFLQMLREETENHECILLFDEVMTSRLAPGGMQGLYNIVPDMTTLGKFWGGGLNFGAFGGSKRIMRHLDTTKNGALSQAGTFNNNILTMTAGLVGARDIYTEDANIELNKRGDDLRTRINVLARTLDVPIQATGVGAVMNIHFHSNVITNPQDVEAPASNLRRLFHLGLLERGFYIAQRGLISLALPHTDDDISSLVDAIESFISHYRPLLRE